MVLGVDPRGGVYHAERLALTGHKSAAGIMVDMDTYIPRMSNAGVKG